MEKEKEFRSDLQIKWDNNGLLPAIAVDFASKSVLMLAYMNRESLKMTLHKGEAVYWSRSRKCIWHKGATSGHVQRVKQNLVDCDQDTLVLLVEQIGRGACHTNKFSCFYRQLDLDSNTNEIDLSKIKLKEIL